MMMDYEDMLSCPVNDRAIKRESIEKREFNVDAFARIDRGGLARGEVERRTLLYVTRNNEQICIQYPGKESIGDIEEKIRPWDFRPKAFNEVGDMMPDLSFKDIWDDIVELHTLDEGTLSLLAAIFYRATMMLDTELICEDYPSVTIDMNTGETIEEGTQTFEWYKINLNSELIDYLNRRIGLIRGFSFEAYLYYNDLLCQNEDCKYFYRDVVVRGGEWNNDVGRHNTYFTHIAIIGYLKGQIRFTQLMDMFQRGMGVAKVSVRDIPFITDNIIYKV